jgi:hypothetical protein
VESHGTISSKLEQQLTRGYGLFILTAIVYLPTNVVEKVSILGVEVKALSVDVLATLLWLIALQTLLSITVNYISGLKKQFHESLIESGEAEVAGAHRGNLPTWEWYTGLLERTRKDFELWSTLELAFHVLPPLACLGYTIFKCWKSVGAGFSALF